MEFTELPFEYETRYADQYEDWNIPMERAALLEERDRQLEDYLAGLGTGTKLPFFVAASGATDESKALSDYVCTGTNDEATIQEAVDAIAAYGDGAPLLLSEGIFNLSDPVSMSSVNDPQVIGAGRHKTILRRTSPVEVEAAISCTLPPSVSGVSFEDFYYGIRHTSGSGNGGSIRDCWFESCTYGVQVGGFGLTHFEVSGCGFYDCYAGVEIYSSSDSTVRGCTFYSNSNADIRLNDCTGVAVLGNTSRASAAFVLVDGSSTGIDITGNEARSVSGTGIWFDPGSDTIDGATVAGNQIEAGTNKALWIEGPSSIATADAPVVVSGNHFEGTATVEARCMLTGNFVSGGLTVNDPCDKALISNNWLGDTDVYGSTAPTITDNTTGTIVETGAGNYLDGTWTP